MSTKENLENQVFMAARDQGVSSVLFRNAVARKLGLNGTDSDCLSFLTINGTSTPTQIARHTGLTTGSTTAMLDRLEKAHYITRKANPDDRRGSLVEVDPHYREVAGPLVMGVQQAHRTLLNSYTDEELKVITHFLKNFTENVVAATKKIEEK